MVNTSATPTGPTVPMRAVEQPTQNNVVVDLEEQRSAPERELVVRLQQQELVAAFGLFALRAPGIERVLDQACQVAARGWGTKYAKVLAYRHATQEFLLFSGVGWNP